MLEKLNHSQLLDVLHSEFRVRSDGDDSVAFTLVEVRDLATPATMPREEGRRSPFSLLFKAPLAFRVEQGMLEMEHESLGSLELFVVPVREDEQGLYYEAVFN